MEICGIKFAPLNVPLHRRLETLAAGGFIFTIIFAGPIGIFLLIYLIFYTLFWPVGLVYLIWIYIIDKDIDEQGGRRIDWVRNWSWWIYLKNYFPVNIKKVASLELDRKQNYMFCCFPHGILPFGPFTNFGSNFSDACELFPYHTPYAITLKENFYVPIVRELFLALGGCSASKKSLHWLLDNPGGGKILILVVGGSAEVFYSRPGEYRLKLKNRKGFIKVALKYGTSLVPVISFGETDIFRKVLSPEGSFKRRVQDSIRKITGVAPVIPLGRGLFIPFRKPLTTVVGRPIEVAKIDNPTQEHIDALHEEFIKKLTELFEEQKYTYLANPGNTFLIID